MEAERALPVGTLSAKVLRADGSVECDLGVISEGTAFGYETEAVRAARRRWRFENKFWRCVQLSILLVVFVIAACTLGWFAALYLSLFGVFFFGVFGIVTNAGVAFEAATFAGGTSTSVFNDHDSGTGTTAAAVTDTALQTPAGGARVAGTQSSSTNVYQTIATITYSGSFAITEWGLFSALTSGTLWDRRVFGAINVVATNAIQFTYQCTFPSGGS